MWGGSGGGVVKEKRWGHTLFSFVLFPPDRPMGMAACSQRNLGAALLSRLLRGQQKLGRSQEPAHTSCTLLFGANPGGDGDGCCWKAASSCFSRPSLKNAAALWGKSSITKQTLFQKGIRVVYSSTVCFQDSSGKVLTSCGSVFLFYFIGSYLKNKFSFKRMCPYKPK